MAETVGKEAFLASADDVIEWSLALEQALWHEESRSRLIRAGRERAARYDWAATAAGTAAVYRQALGEA